VLFRSFIKKNLSLVLIGIVALSFMPAVVEYLRARFGGGEPA
jgi:hypothetical protein